MRQANLLRDAPFPVYTLAYPSYDLHCRSVNYSHTEDGIVGLDLIYSGPGFDFDDASRVAIIQHRDIRQWTNLLPNQDSHNDQQQMIGDAIPRSLLSNLILGLLPGQYGPRHDPEYVHTSLISRLLQGAEPEPVATPAFNFNVLHWHEPYPMSIASSYTKELALGIGSAGISPPEFLAMLSSLELVSGNDERIGELQRELTEAGEFLRRKYRRL